jgi:hypothetical protein
MKFQRINAYTFFHCSGPFRPRPLNVPIKMITFAEKKLTNYKKY